MRIPGADRAEHLIERTLTPLGKRFMRKHLATLSKMPSERGPKVPAPWSRPGYQVPDDLRTVAGIWRDPENEERAYREHPLQRFFALHPEAEPWVLERSWRYLIPAGGRMLRAVMQSAVVAARKPAETVKAASSARLAAEVRDKGAEFGLSTIGFADYDPKYTFAQWAGTHAEGTVIVCAVEQDWEATQTAPSTRSEKAAVHGYSDVMEGATKLAEYLQGRGFSAAPHDFVGQTVVIHYGVQAGLGQLGLNGQLLTPQAGSRVRLVIITTDLDLPEDGPVDYGINGVCDRCQACVRRCPSGAIPLKRAEHRGVTKSKIKLDRCLPVVGQAEGCAVCMKVCPVQKYGMARVVQHFEATGDILGKGTDELEGYRWPLDQKFYGAGEKPRIDSRQLLRPPDLVLDPTRTEPRDTKDLALG